MDIQITTLPDTTVAYQRHTGPDGSPGIGQPWARFAAWRGPRGLFAPGRKVIGISQDRPDLPPADKLRDDACVEVDAGLRPEGEVGVQQLAGGRHALARFDVEARGRFSCLLCLPLKPL